MHTITTKIPEDVYQRLETLGKVIDRKKNYLVRKAIENFLDEQGDYFIALHRLEQNSDRYSLEQVEDMNNDLLD